MEFLLYVRGRFVNHSGRNSLHPNAALRRGQVTRSCGNMRKKTGKRNVKTRTRPDRAGVNATGVGATRIFREPGFSAPPAGRIKPMIGSRICGAVCRL